MSQKVFSENKNLIIKKTRNGNGVFTKRAFTTGERIFEVRGPLITCNEDDDLDETTRANAYRYSEDLYISPKGTVGDFLNHSCNPNARVVKVGKKLFIIALKTIPAQREVFIDYSTIIASDDVWNMSCNCGSTLCRGKIRSFKTLPKEIKEKYIKQHIVPSFLLEF